MAGRVKRLVVKNKVFIPAYLKAVKDGLTQQQFADQLGMNVDTVRVRISNLKEKAAESNRTLPDLKDARQGRKAQTQEDFLAQLDSAFEAAGLPVEDDGEDEGEDDGDETE